MKRLLAILALITVLMGGATAAWYPRTADYTTTGALNGGDLSVTDDVVFSGIDVDAAPVSFVTATYTSSMAGANNDIVFTAVPGATYGGTLGNSIDIILEDPGEDTGACSVSTNLSIPEITVTLSYGTGAINATAAAVIAAIAADENASLIVSCDNYSTDTGAGVVTALASQDLSGGINGTEGTTGEVRYYSGDLYYLVSGSEIYDATWAQWDGGDTDGTVISTRDISTTGDLTVDDITAEGDVVVTGTITNDKVSHYWYTQTIETPVVADVDRLYVDLDCNATETEYVFDTSDTDTQPDVARTLSLTPNASSVSWFFFEGTDIDGNEIEEFINLTGSGTTTIVGNKAFATVTNMTWDNTGGNSTEVDVGVSDELGLDYIVADTAQIIAASLDAVREGTYPTIASGTTLSENTIDIQETLTGTKDVVIYSVRS